jgi:hypothetical protein
MEQMTRIERSQRFLREFGPDAMRAVNLVSPLEIVAQDIQFIDGEDLVRFCITVRDGAGKEVDFVSECVWFDPSECSDPDIVDRVATLLDEPEYHTALRLKRADLINTDPEVWNEDRDRNSDADGDVQVER